MRGEPRWRRYLRFWGADPRADVEDELAFHIAERAALNERRGLSPEAARAEAERRFGDVGRIRSECISASEREARRRTWTDRFNDVARDVRVALRSLAGAPLFTLTAGAALALGIGANSAVFSVVSAVLLRPLPYAEAERVVTVYNRWDGADQAALSPAEYLDFAARVRAFETIGVYAGTFVNLMREEGAERVPAALATPSALTALGVTPVHGRLFSEAEGVPGGERVAVLTYAFWQSHFNGSRAIVGASLTMDGNPYTVVGVLPPGVRLPNAYASADPAALVVPFRVDAATAEASRGSHFLAAVARLAPGWSVEAASTEVSGVARALAVEHPDDYPADMRFDGFVRPVHEDVVGGSRRLLLLLTGAVAMVLLIACANVASLVLTRAEERRREVAVRSALGAGRWRIARQILIEHLVLALGAGAAGLVVAYAAVEALVTLRPTEIPRLEAIGIDARVLAFTVAASLLATVLVALAPLRMGASAHAVLRDGGTRTTASRASQRARRALIVTEVALSIVLLAGAGLLLRSFTKLLAVDPGYRTEQVLTVPISLPFTGYPDDDARRRFFAQLVADVARMPGVHAAGAVLNLPLATTVGDLGIEIEGRPVADTDVSPRLDWQVVTPGWFEAMDVDILRGRGIVASDDATGPGAVVLSETAARKYWGGGDALGQRFKLGGDAGPGWVTVVGIARDVRHGALSAEPPEVMYLPHAQFTFWNGGPASSVMTLVAHTASPPLSLVPTLRDHLRRMDPRVPLGTPRTMSEVVSTAVAAPRFATSVLGSFAVLALTLAMIGVYGLVGYTVARRTREIAVRMALGADGRSVVGQMLVQGMRPVLLGVVVGGVAALGLTRLLQQMLYGVTPHDPLTLLATLIILPATAVAACLVPARRATRVAPFAALREE